MKFCSLSKRNNRKLRLLYVWLVFLLWALLTNPLNTVGCSLPTDSIDSELFPPQVRDSYCNLEADFEPLLLIRAAVNEDSPIFRIIAVVKDDKNIVQKVRLYQFDKDGCAHKKFKGESQDIVDFKRSSSCFEGRIKCRDTAISFVDRTFNFKMGGIFGLQFEQELDNSGNMVIGERRASALLIATSKKKNWRWVLDNGSMVNF